MTVFFGLMLAAGATQALEPSDRWVVDFDDSQCVAMRDYGEGKDALRVAFKPSPGGRGMEIAFFERGNVLGNATPDSRLMFDDREVKSAVLRYQLEDRGQRVTRFLTSATEKDLAGVEEISAKFGFGTYHLALRQSNSISSVLSDCMADLRAQWNVPAHVDETERELPTGAQNAPIVKSSPDNLDKDAEKPAFGNPHPVPVRALQSLFTSDDYPPEAMNAGVRASSQAHLLVGEDGRVKDCTLHILDGNAFLMMRACDVLTERARFHPATLTDGTPIKGYYVSPRVIFNMSRI